MYIYKSCDTLPIYFFYKIINTDNYKFLVKDYSIDNEIKITEEQESELYLIFKKIIYEYSELTSSRRIKLRYEKEIKIVEMEYEYDYCINAIQLYKKYGFFEVLVLLNDYGHNITGDKDIFKQLEVVNNKLKGLVNRIKIAKISFERKYNKDKEKINDKNFNFKLEKEAAQLQINLDTSFIDTKKTSVSRWIVLIEINKEKNLAYGQIRYKNKRSSRRR